MDEPNIQQPLRPAVPSVPSCAESAFPLSFAKKSASAAAITYLREPCLRRLVDFFERKGLAAIKEEDRLEQWYADWLTFQADHRLYATVLSPREFSSVGGQFDLLRYARFLEGFAYYSPGHGYSVQVSFLGLWAILMGPNTALKRDAIATLEAGGLLGLGVSEKEHGADLLGNTFTLRRASPGKLIANGSKHYIGNANVAAMIAVLGKMDDGRERRMTPGLFALRPASSPGFGNVRKIGTIGVRAAFVGSFEIREQEFPESDLIAEGRQAWDAVLGAVTYGKFFLGFGSIGIGEHALAEACDHLRRRTLYGKPVIAMPHIRRLVSEAYVRLTAMKFYAYRALDYLQAANAEDRRFILFAAVQKARVSTQGVKVIALLSECIGAKGFESDTYFEMARRDIELIPSLEGSTHINLALTAQFVPAYFKQDGAAAGLVDPPSLVAGETPSDENSFLMDMRTTALHTIVFGDCLKAYAPLRAIATVRVFEKRVKAFARFVNEGIGSRPVKEDVQLSLIMGRCLATIAYGQLVAEASARHRAPAELVWVMFQLLVEDLSETARAMMSTCPLDAAAGVLIRRVPAIVRSTEQHQAAWTCVAEQACAFGK